MTITNPRTRGDYVVGTAWQTAEGSGASVSNARFIVARNVTPSREQSYIDPQGTHGSRFDRDTHRQVAEEPSVELTLWGSVEAMPTFLESATMGQPTVSNSQLTVTNDGGSYVSSLSFTGVRPGFNTAWSAYGSCILYVSITDGGGGTGHTVNIYSDVGLSSLVATGTGNDSATVTLAESNNSGLTGSITLGTISGNDTDIVATINTISYALAAQPARFFTMFVDDGQKMETYTDCVVQTLTLESSDREALEITLTVKAKTHAIGSSSATVSIDHLNVYAHQDTTLRTDIEGSAVTQSPSAVSFGIENDLEGALAGSATPTKMILRGVTFPFTTTHVHSDEAQTIIDRDEAGTWYAADVKWTRASKNLTITLDRIKPMETRQPPFADRTISPAEIQWAVREATGASPDNPVTITLQP